MSRGLALIRSGDRSPPRACLGAAGLDERLEPLQVASHTRANRAHRVPDRLDRAARLERHLHRHERPVVVEPVERDDARVLRAVRAAPCDALVGSLLGDLRVPLADDATDLSRPVQPAVIQLLHPLDAAHEARELLELRPLVVRRAKRHVDLDRLLHVDRVHLLHPEREARDRVRGGGTDERVHDARRRGLLSEDAGDEVPVGESDEAPVDAPDGDERRGDRVERIHVPSSCYVRSSLAFPAASWWKQPNPPHVRALTGRGWSMPGAGTMRAGSARFGSEHRRRRSNPALANASPRAGGAVESSDGDAGAGARYRAWSGW